MREVLLRLLKACCPVLSESRFTQDLLCKPWGSGFPSLPYRCKELCCQSHAHAMLVGTLDFGLGPITERTEAEMEISQGLLAGLAFGEHLFHVQSFILQALR